jgi:OOP family OmpA-OmpF porin
LLSFDFANIMSLKIKNKHSQGIMMNKLLIAATLSTACLSFHAKSDENESSGAYINFGQNYINFENDRSIRDENDFYLGLGYQLSNQWGLELEYTELDASSTISTPLTVDLWSINSIHRQYAKGQSSVFWKMGLGQYDIAQVDDTAARLGIGYDFAVTNKFSWVLGADTTFTGNANPDLIAYAGMSYFFGQSKAKAIAAPVISKPKDDDNDGVINMNDRCPTSPAGVTVDSRGCEIDSDKDGVKDSVDQCLATPAGAKVDSKGCRIMLAEDVSIRLNVKFANNSNVVSNEYHQEISKVATFMKQYPDTRVVIEGHTDSRGSANYNQQLSQKRATAVMQYLIDNFSISSARVSSIGKGEETPIADNNTAEGRATNRRVQAEIKTRVNKAQ